MNKLFLTAAFLAAGTSATFSLAHAVGKAAGKTTSKSAVRSTPAPPLPQYVSLQTLKKWQKQHDPRKMPIALQPLIDGKSLKGQDRRDLITNPPLVVMSARAGEDGNVVEVGAQADASIALPDAPEADASTPVATGAGLNGARLAQTPRIPRPIAPARPRPRAPRTITPRWVRYPLEFQLCGIGLGMKAVDKDKYNRIDRYGLFAIHGNPTAVVVPTVAGGVSVNQQPPEVASFFADDPGAGLPNWAAAITVQLDNNHVEWLYRRDTYAMGFVVDRLGYVDAIVVAGVYSPIARTQLEDPVHTVKLGDDLRKVLFRYGYPDTIETYLINAAAGVAVTTPAAGGTDQGAGAAGAGAAGAGAAASTPATPAQAGGAAGAGAAAGAGGAANAAYRTFEVRYEQSYNVVFTIRNNRVVRIYIFGDPDFFNLQRREALRKQY